MPATTLWKTTVAADISSKVGHVVLSLCASARPVSARTNEKLYGGVSVICSCPLLCDTLLTEDSQISKPLELPQMLTLPSRSYIFQH